MKKMIAMILLTALTIGLIACAPQDTTETQSALAGDGTFCVGYAEKLINPIEPMPLSGYGNTSTRISQNITDDLFARCTALRDADGNTMLIFTLDMCTVNDHIRECVPHVSNATGVASTNIWINVSHTHSAPDMGNGTESAVPRYNEYFKNQLIAAATEAVADLKTAKMYYGTVETEGLSWIRHFLMDDGSYGGDSFGDWDNHYALEHTAEPDTTMHILKFTREGGKDVVLTNWRVHPGLTAGSGFGVDASSDVIGPYRDVLEDMTDSHVMYLQGHAGNTNPGSRIASEVLYEDYKEYGALLAGFAYEGMQNMVEVEVGEVKNTQYVVTAEVNHSDDHRLLEAKSINTIWRTTNDRARCIEMGKPYGIRSPYHAGAIVARAAMDKTDDITIYALSIGENVGMTAGPAELFDRNSMAIEEASPYEYTLCLAYTNDHKLYIPADYVFEYGSYETDTTRYVRGTAEQIERAMLEMLNQLKGN